MPAQFVLKKGSTGKFRFNLVARNGQVIATSEAYETRAKALAGIESVRKNAPDAVLVDGTAPAAKPAATATRQAGTARTTAAKLAAGRSRAAGRATGATTSGTSAGPIAGPGGRTAADVKPQSARGQRSPKKPPAVTPEDAKGSGGGRKPAAAKALTRAVKKVTSRT
ncbi:MAG TPA: YegP family protein [Frankiaceae bacterium]|nr:YegP family protein [Frankiaceae bacterium]